VDFEEAFLCISTPSLHPRLRAAYGKMLMYTYVDVDPHVPDMETIDINFVRVCVWSLSLYYL
jgi:hypothetical protein